MLANAYKNALLLAAENNIKSIAFPNISTGIYHFPKQLAAEIAVAQVKNITATNKLPEQVIFVCFDDENYEIYKRLLTQ